MYAIVTIDKLKFTAIIGCERAERDLEQEVVVDLRMGVNAAPAIEMDRIEAAVDYEEVAQVIQETVCSGKFHLLERMAAAVIQAIEERFPVEEVWVRVSKPNAIASAQSCSVELEKECAPV